jgi:MtaA/CmuA family methyltransferase
MTNKELLLKALRNEKTQRDPWVPFVGVHGGNLINCPADEYLKSGEKIAEGILKANELYSPDGIPILFDLQIEAELLGCEVQWAEKVPPSVVSHPLETGNIEDLPEFSTEKGRFPEVKKALKTVKDKIGDDVALYGLITGPFTLALHLFGNNIFLDMLMNPDKIKNILTYCSEIATTTAKFYIENGADVIALVDPMTSQISPEHFNEFITSVVNSIFDFIRQEKALSSLFVCGDATRNLEEMCKTSCDNISIDEQISLEYLKSLSTKYDKSIGGNLQLTAVLLFGDETDCKINAINCLEAGGTKGFVLSPGCDIPYDCPPKNLIAVSEVAHDEYKRNIAKTLVARKPDDSAVNVTLPDYENSKKVIIEIITLDSASCPPCFYMVEAVKKASSIFSLKVDIREYKISTKEGLAYMQKLQVKNLPTICINGEIAYSSIIPDIETLKSTIMSYF